MSSTARQPSQACELIVHAQAPAQQGKQSPSAKVTELTPAEAARESGNAAFKKGDLQKASHPHLLHKAQIAQCHRNSVRGKEQHGYCECQMGTFIRIERVKAAEAWA